MVKNMNNTKIEIKNLYKIFGAKDKSFVDSIKNGMSKQELLDQHNHVLGLDNINSVQKFKPFIRRLEKTEFEGILD